MRLDPELCYPIIRSRDERHDGRFFTGVMTTGVYCRPVCPARTPRAENVRFFACAAAAEEAGFRPCLRCRPEASPGTPAWDGTSAVVSRALQLIEDGALDGGSVDGLATRLHVGARQLRRLFKQHLGAPPVAIAQTRRVQFAKKLIDETPLPMSEIAFCAGFSSIRRFNAAFRNAYGRTPTDLRRSGPHSDAGAEEFTIQLKLPYRPPFDWQSLANFLRARAIPGVEVVDRMIYRRTVVIGDATGVIEVQSVAGQRHLLLKVPSNLSKGLAQIVERARRLFDLKADPVLIAAHLARDPQLAAIADAYPGLRVPGAWDGFEVAVRAILGQQVSVKSATTMSGRLARAFGESLDVSHNGLDRLFPQPERLADADLMQIGLMRQRATAIRELARASRDGRLTFSISAGLEEALETLTALPGVGPWTAHYIAMRALGEPDAFPSGDLALRRATARADKPLTENRLLERAEAWRPWRAYAAIYLWTNYADQQTEVLS